MKRNAPRRLVALLLAAPILGPLSSADAAVPTQCIYVANHFSNNVSAVQVKIKGNKKKVRKLIPRFVATIPVGRGPWGIVVDPVAGSFVLVANSKDGTVSRIDTATNTVTATIAVGKQPRAMSISADGLRAYVGNYKANSISIIDTADNSVIDTVKLAVKRPVDIEVDPSGSRLIVLSKKSKAFEQITLSGAGGREAAANAGTRSGVEVPFGACTDLIVQAVPGFEEFFTVAGACGEQLCRYAAPDGTTACFDSPLGGADLIAGRQDCESGCETMIAQRDSGTIVFENPEGATADSALLAFEPRGLATASTSSTLAAGANWTMGTSVGFDGDGGLERAPVPADYPGLLRIFIVDTRAATPKVVLHELVELPDARGSFAATDVPV